MRAFAIATRAWCLHEALKLWYIPASPLWKTLSWLIVLASSARPAPKTFALALVVRLADTLSIMPVMWDSYYWCLQVDGGLLLCVGYLALVRGLLADSHADSLAAWWATTARQQLAIFYLAAGVWKVNTSFLDARTSCAPIFVLTLLQTLGYTPPPLRASQLALLAPGVTILGELTIGILLLLPSRAAVRIGVLSALLLHLGIALAPPPNNATPFSLTCVVRLLITESAAVARAWDELGASGSGIGQYLATPAIGMLLASLCMGICYRRALAFPPTAFGAELDWWVGTYTCLAVLIARAMYSDVANMPTPTTKSLARGLRPALVLLALAYAFGGPLLGIHDLGACNMYSNLRMYAGTNHLFLPTGLIGHVWPEATQLVQLVRVEQSSSAYINSIYPGEVTSQIAPGELSLLADAGHSAHMFNAMKARILGPAFAPAHAAFHRYTVTALEMKRLLAEARATGEKFEITYTLLDATGGDERWRRDSLGRTVTLKADGKGKRSCTVGCGPLELIPCPCAADELPLQPPPSYWASKTLIQQPYPIVDDAHKWEGELVCFGP